ncbi:MAG TPA: DUF58 domain-containing protein [Oligoflexia bacterium]|nr:DUF58 domain-containing protein [Oligoflexia bacterium]HMP47110.1 DUF58 domain-containing protein [Oligoflexia bacterium]
MRTIINRSALTWFSILQGVGAFALFHDFAWIPYTCGMLICLCICIYDYLCLPHFSDISLSVKLPEDMELGQIVFSSLVLAIKGFNRPKNDSIKVRDINVSNLEVKVLDHVLSDPVQKITEFTIKLEITPAKIGKASSFFVILESCSFFGFLSRVYSFDQFISELNVSPQRSVIPDALFQVISKNQKLLRQGSHIIKKTRAAEQFHSIRDYRFPDPVRYIDHKKSAKFGTLMTRTYESLHSYHLVICLDVGRPMFGLIDQSRKLDYYLSSCSQIARYALKMGDEVSFVAFSQKPHIRLSRTKSVGQFVNSLTSPLIQEPYEEESNYALITSALPLLNTSRSVVLILSDTSHPFVRSSLLDAMKVLSRKHLVCSLSLLDKEYDIVSMVQNFDEDTFSIDKACKAIYAYWMDEQMEIFSGRVNSFGAGSLVIPDTFWLSATERIYRVLRESGRG